MRVAHPQRHEVAFLPFDERLPLINGVIKPGYRELGVGGGG